MKPRMVNDVAILCPRGWMMGGNETDDFTKAVRDLIEQGNRRLVIDLSDVSHMNSTALGAIIGLHTAYRNRQGRMALCHLEAKIQHILVLTRLALVFDVYPNEREAVASFEREESPTG